MARRTGYPYNGRRFLLNVNTNELHDLDDERNGCQINEIKTHHIEMFDSLPVGLNHQKVIFGKQNGCKWCLSAYSTD